MPITKTTFDQVEVGQFFLGSGSDDLLRRIAPGSDPEWPRANFVNTVTGLHGACGPLAPVTLIEFPPAHSHKVATAIIVKSIDVATSNIAKLSEEEKAGWLAYIGESVEAACGVGALERLYHEIAERWRNGGW